MTPRYLRGYGLIELPLNECAERLKSADLAGRSTLHIHSSKELSGRLKSCSRREAVEHLNHLTHPSTRWALFAIGERWTAVLTNLRDGSDPIRPTTPGTPTYGVASNGWLTSRRTPRVWSGT